MTNSVMAQEPELQFEVNTAAPDLQLWIWMAPDTCVEENYWTCPNSLHNSPELVGAGK